MCWVRCKKLWETEPSCIIIFYCLIYAIDHFWWVCVQTRVYTSARAISWSTTFGSARVLVSPSSSNCLEAIFLRILLIIFPLLVFGRPGAQWTLSGAANAPIWKMLIRILHTCGYSSIAYGRYIQTRRLKVRFITRFPGWTTCQPIQI